MVNLRKTLFKVDIRQSSGTIIKTKIFCDKDLAMKFLKEYKIAGYLTRCIRLIAYTKWYYFTNRIHVLTLLQTTIFFNHFISC